MDSSHYEEIKTQIEIVASLNQQLGVYELSRELDPKKSVLQKLNAKKAEVRNATMILKNMIRDYSGGVSRSGNLADLMGND